VDFPTLLVLATFITGLIWGVDRLAFAPRRQAKADALKVQGANDEAIEEALSESVLVENARYFFPVILIVLVVRSFLVEPFRIPSNSMMPTLLTGDFILVNKFAYGLRLPVLNSKVLDLGEPKRGDVIVFRYPENPKIDYIKRVVGLPGDHVSYYNKTVYINGQRVEQKLLGSYLGVGAGRGMTGTSLREEALMGVDHSILVMENRPRGDFEYVVGEHEYFVLGDNRDNSRDSRYWGTVPDANLVGKAFMIWMNWDSDADGIDWSRIGKSVH